MAKQDECTSEMENAREVLQIILVTRDQPTIILEPCKQQLNLPSLTIATQRSSILRHVSAVRAMRCDHLHTSFGEFLIELVGVVGIIANQTLDRFFHKDLCKGLHYQLDFVWRGAICANRDRKTVTVCDGHNLSRSETAVDEGFFQIESATAAQVLRQSLQHTAHATGANPLPDNDRANRPRVRRC